MKLEGKILRPVLGGRTVAPGARSLIEAHGGRIFAESIVGEGTTIGFDRPVFREQVAGDSERISSVLARERGHVASAGMR